jgi:hypothetical protein
MLSHGTVRRTAVALLALGLLMAMQTNAHLNQRRTRAFTVLKRGEGTHTVHLAARSDVGMDGVSTNNDNDDDKAAVTCTFSYSTTPESAATQATRKAKEAKEAAAAKKLKAAAAAARAERLAAGVAAGKGRHELVDVLKTLHGRCAEQKFGYWIFESRQRFDCSRDVTLCALLCCW